MWDYKILKEQLIFFCSEKKMFLFSIHYVFLLGFAGLVGVFLFFSFACVVCLAFFNSSVCFRSIFKSKKFNLIPYPSFFRQKCLRYLSQTNDWSLNCSYWYKTKYQKQYLFHSFFPFSCFKFLWLEIFKTLNIDSHLIARVYFVKIKDKSLQWFSWNPNAYCRVWLYKP